MATDTQNGSPFPASIVSSGGGDLVRIATITAPTGGLAAIDFASIPATYGTLKIIGSVKGTVADQYYRMQFNGDTAANYDFQVLAFSSGTPAAGDNGAQTSIRMDNLAPLGSGGSSVFTTFEASLNHYATTLHHKNMLFEGMVIDYGVPGSRIVKGGARWRSLAAINRIRLFADSGNFAEGSTVTLYGLNA